MLKQLNQCLKIVLNLNPLNLVGGDVAFGANWQDGTNNRWTNAQQMFYNCEKLTKLPFGNYISAFIICKMLLECLQTVKFDRD